ncbi:MAG: hypothetical protein M1814_002047 [Vezdaea aestivalis]|nr:MAG: hypothetical protein M1814_002047 [Vezdaea aestivalis]
MKFIRANTSVPVPLIRDYYINKDAVSWMLMERVDGSSLDSAWPELSQEAQMITISDLHGYFGQLQQLQPTRVGWIGSCEGGPAYDHRLNNGFPCGPFESVSDFHDFLVAPIKRCPKPELALKYRPRLKDDHSVHFVHSDFAPEHVFVDQKTGRVTGIIDWEMAGFWPGWWEYRKARYGYLYMKWWVDLVDKIMPIFMEELDVDQDLECF